MITLLEFLNNNIGLITLISGVIVWIVYSRTKRDAKRDAAKIIIQEIRRAEEVIREYEDNRQYKFTRKIIAVNSWAKNIHFFVGVLDSDEIDKISNLYSIGEYLDSIIKKVSDAIFDEDIKSYPDKSKFKEATVNVPLMTLKIPTAAQKGKGTVIEKKVNIPMPPPAPWTSLFDVIVSKYEPIYHSTVVEKLKRIAKHKIKIEI